MAISMDTIKDPITFTLTQNTWVKVLEPDARRKYLSIENEDATKIARAQFPFRNNPFAYNFASSDIVITPILSAPNTWATATRGIIEIRFKFDNTPSTDETLIDFHDDNGNEFFSIWLDTSSKLVAEVNDAGTTQWKITADVALTAAEWYTLRFEMRPPRETPDAAIAPRFYVNGAAWPVTQNTTTDLTKFMSALGSVDIAYIGAASDEASGKTEQFDGSIDYVRIIEDDTVGGTLRQVEVAHYPLDEGTGTTANDQYQHGDDGTITAGSGGWVSRGTGLKIYPESTRSFDIKNNDFDIRRALWMHSDSTSHTVQVRAGREEN